MPSALIAVDNSGKVTQWNKTAEEYISSDRHLKKGEEIWNLISDLGIYKDEIVKIINERDHREIYREPYRKGEKKNVSIHLYPLIANGVKGSVIRIDDITELRKKEEQLRQAQKMETIGTLAGGIAHDFNNILSGIVGVVSILKYKMEKGPSLDKEQLGEYLDIMEKSGERAGDIVQRLLTLSKKQNTNPKRVVLAEVVKQVINICRNTFDKKITIIGRNLENRSCVYADFTQIEQIILNLSINAYHAMTIMRPEGEKQEGELILEIKETGVTAEIRDLVNSSETRNFVKIAVIDNGIGMDKETVRQIFEPFFSTKDKSVGTGLGLTIVQNIIQQFGGFIDVNTEPGRGTEFKIFLPMLEAADILEEQISISSIKKGEGTVLVIDDEPVLRELARSMLNQAGYEVITAEDGITGLNIYREKKDSISAVLLDMVLPVMNGKETFEEIKKIDRDVKVIVTSGFAKDSRVEAILNSGALDFIQKPFTIYSLSEKIYSIVMKGKNGDGEKGTA